MMATIRLCILVLIVSSLTLAGCSAGVSQTPTAEPTVTSQEAERGATEVPTAAPTLTSAPTEEATPAPPSPTAATTPEYPAPPTRVPDAYPGSTAAQPEPTSPENAPTFVPETPQPEAPAEGLATITGTLMRQVEGMPPSAMQDTTVFLASLLTDEQGQTSGLARLNEDESPWTRTNEAGQFVFTDLTPGRYALIVKTPLTLQPVKDANTARDVVVDVAAGEVGELGVIPVSIGY